MPLGGGQQGGGQWVAAHPLPPERQLLKTGLSLNNSLIVVGFIKHISLKNSKHFPIPILPCLGSPSYSIPVSRGV